MLKLDFVHLQNDSLCYNFCSDGTGRPQISSGMGHVVRGEGTRDEGTKPYKERLRGRVGSVLVVH